MTAGIANRAERRRHGGAEAELNAALEHHRAGRLERAEHLYRAVLKKSPANADALHLLGVLALDRGRSERAIQLIDKAIAAAPDFAEAHMSLGNALRAAGRQTDALASYRHAIALQPDVAAAHNNLGQLLRELGEPSAAIASFEQAIRLDPSFFEAHANLASTLRSEGRLEDAEAAARRALRLRPEDPALNANLGNILTDRQQYEPAIAAYRAAIALAPGFAPAHVGLANVLRLSGAMTEAIDIYRRTLELRPREAILWNDLGRALRAVGRFEEATDAFRSALEIAPDLADAYRNLATCRALADATDGMARAAALAARDDLPVEDRAAAQFAIAKALDDAERYDEAFAAYDRANSLYRDARAAQGDRFDAAALHRQVSDAIAAFTPGFFAKVRGWGDPSQLPVFIVGMPRSGTSLVEQIAASHSQIFGAGELKQIGQIAAELGAPEQWRQAAIHESAARHLQRLRELGSNASRVIDKLPDNIFQLGLIATLFPAARIIFCRRDPRDIGLSCFCQKFSPGQLTFSYDLADCGRRWRETERLAEHWRQVLPLPMHDIDYERLVADLEGESRRLIAFLGLEWEHACLDFHRTQRTVQTASGWQVRQPLYDRSVGRWQHYARHLAPLFAALADGDAVR